MPVTITINAARIVRASLDLDASTMVGTLTAQYLLGTFDGTTFTPYPSATAVHGYSEGITADEGGALGAAQRIVPAIAAATGLDPTQGDSIQ